MIITPEIVQLVYQIEATGQIQPYFSQLVRTLYQNCLNAQKLPVHSKGFSAYPIVDGYAVSFDPLTQEKDLKDHWHRYGFVVGKNVVSSDTCLSAVNRILEISQSFGEYLPRDSAGVPLLSRGFFEIYHDNSLAQIRQSLRLYLYHVLLWGTPFLWTTFDRLGVKLPEGEESKGLPLHVDQNPTVHPDFRTIQGVLALVDCPIERGTFVGVPSSIENFSQYAQFIPHGYQGEYILLPESSAADFKSREQVIPLKAGNIVSWDSRTTHRNSTNYSSDNRYVAYISTGVAREDNPLLVEARKNNFRTGMGENYRDAYLHASKKPRFTDREFIDRIRQHEELSVLGNCLYGLTRYKDYL